MQYVRIWLSYFSLLPAIFEFYLQQTQTSRFNTDGCRDIFEAQGRSCKAR